MSNLPQIHDWMFNLLTPGQWLFIYIASVIALFVALLVMFSRTDEQEMGGVAFGLAICAFPAFALVMLALGNFISFMIFLWYGGV